MAFSISLSFSLGLVSRETSFGTDAKQFCFVLMIESAITSKMSGRPLTKVLFVSNFGTACSVLWILQSSSRTHF